MSISHSKLKLTYLEDEILFIRLTCIHFENHQSEFVASSPSI